MINTKTNYVFEKSCIRVDNKIMSWTLRVSYKKKNRRKWKRKTLIIRVWFLFGVRPFFIKFTQRLNAECRDVYYTVQCATMKVWNKYTVIRCTGKGCVEKWQTTQLFRVSGVELTLGYSTHACTHTHCAMWLMDFISI